MTPIIERPSLELACGVAFVLRLAEISLGIEPNEAIPLEARLDRALYGAMNDPVAISEAAYGVLYTMRHPSAC
jgi:hypothetical protein